MYYTSLDPFRKREVFIARHLRDRKLQRALLQFFKPENYFEVREALTDAGRTDLIGGGCDAAVAMRRLRCGGCDALIPSQPPKEALEARRERANTAVRGDHVHTIANPAKKAGYRPGRKSARRQGRRGTP